MSEHLMLQSDHLLGRLKQLQTRYPTLVRDVCTRELVVTVEFYLADVAIDAAYGLLEAGITAVHRLDNPKIVSLQLPSLIDQGQMSLAVSVLDRFLRVHGKC